MKRQIMADGWPACMQLINAERRRRRNNLSALRRMNDNRIAPQSDGDGDVTHDLMRLRHRDVSLSSSSSSR